MSNVICEGGSKIMLKIRVPKGKKAIYVPGKEAELIFAHKTQLRLLDYYIGTMACKEKEFYAINDVAIYDFQML